MKREDLGILLIAALCHDVDHPGYNNTYVLMGDIGVEYEGGEWCIRTGGKSRV